MPSTWLARADMRLGVNAIHICTMHLVSMESVPVTVIHICTMRVGRLNFAEYGFFKAPMPSKARAYMGLGGQRHFSICCIACANFA